MLAALLIVGPSLLHFTALPAGPNVITWDVYGYYAYLPATLTYGLGDNYNFVAQHFADYDISSSSYQIAEVIDGQRAPIYTIGMALLWLPGYIIATGVAGFGESYPQDGLAAPYQWAVIISSWIFSCLGIYWLRLVLLRYFTDIIVATVIICVFVGTNYHHYAVFEPGMSHTYLLSLYAALLLHTIRWHDRPNWTSTILVGLSVALLCLARPSEILCLLLPLLYGISGRASLANKFAMLRREWPHVLLLGVVGIALVSIQLLYWQHTLGLWLFNGYAAEHHFDFLAPHLLEGLFSFRKGWLLYTPIMVFPLLGFTMSNFRRSDWAWSVSLFVLFNIYVVLSWHMWWYASSFGMRALIQSYAVLSIPFAYALSTLFSKTWTAWATGAALLFCLGLNQFQAWQYRHRILPLDETTSTFYRQAWGQTRLDPANYLLLDNNEQLPAGTDYRLQPLLSFSAQRDSFAASPPDSYYGRLAVRQDPAQEYGPTLNYIIQDATEAQAWAGAWLAVRAQLLAGSDNFSESEAARVVVDLTSASGERKWRGIRWQRYQPVKQWLEINFELQMLDALAPGDQIRVYTWNPSPDTIYIDKLEVQLLLPK